MDKFLKEIFIKIKSKELVNSTRSRAKWSKECGEIPSWLKSSEVTELLIIFPHIFIYASAVVLIVITKILEFQRYGSSSRQQHPELFLFSYGLRRVVAGPDLLSFWPVAPGLLCTFDLISVERVVKAFSTLTASLAEVSKNLIPRESANVFPSSAFTCLLA